MNAKTAVMLITIAYEAIKFYKQYKKEKVDS